MEQSIFEQTSRFSDLLEQCVWLRFFSMMTIDVSTTMRTVFSIQFVASMVFHLVVSRVSLSRMCFNKNLFSYQRFVVGGINLREKKREIKTIVTKPKKKLCQRIPTVSSTYLVEFHSIELNQ